MLSYSWSFCSEYGFFSIRKAYLTEQEKKTEYKNSEYFLKHKCLILQVTPETGK